jgi:Domain of unknown function (DUF5916)
MRRPSLGLSLCSALLTSQWIAAGAQADISIDGLLDESEWQSATTCSDWVRTQPFVLDEPRHRNEARVVSTPAGLAVAFRLQQPSAGRTKPRTPRDAGDFHGDSVSFMVDFDADGRVGFEFSVALGLGVRDGLITNQNERSTDWDGVWQHAVRETDDEWFVELLIPWSTASMRDGDTDQRTIAVFFERTVFDRNERYACPGASIERPVFLSDFRHFTIQQYRAAQLDVVPYGTWVADLLNDSSRFKVGADIFWKPSSDFQLVAALNPDFGQVESDELVINFSAIETFYTDKRPFFTENQGVFDLRTPDEGQLIYTRRVGASSDDGLQAISDIDAALKLNGSAGRVVYGAFAAMEDQYADDTGRLFAATRLSLPLDGFRLGHLATFADRPFLERQALVNALDYELHPEGRWRWSGQFIRSDIDVAGARTHGYQVWLQTDFDQTPVLTHSLKLQQVDEQFEMDDLGYLVRNDLRHAAWESRWSRAGFAEDSRLAGETYQFNLAYRENMAGVNLPFYSTLIRDTQYGSGWLGHEELNYESAGTDDLLTRGNGPVKLDSRAFIYGRYTTPRYGAWQHAFGGYVFQEGVDGFGYEIELTESWYPRDGLTLNLTLYPRLSDDWLLWQEGNLLGTYEARRLDAYGRIDWLPVPGHELRVKLQWIGIDATPTQAYRTTERGDLVPSADSLSPFTVNNLGIQVRYRYQFGPLSDLYVVYSRGGYAFREDDDRDLKDLFGDLNQVRDADQFLIKVRYRL